MNYLGLGKVELKDVEKALKELPLKEKIKLAAIYKKYKDIMAITERKNEAVRGIEKAYLKLDNPILHNISELVSGKRPIRPDEVKDPSKYLSEEEVAIIPQHLEAKEIKGYWATCLKNSATVNNIIGPEDGELLNCIQNIRIQDEEGTENFTMIFNIKENTFISNKVLSKKFVLSKEGDPKRCEATPIEWIGKNLTVKEIKKKQKNKKTGQNRMVTRTVDAKSFFKLFRTVQGKQIDLNNPDEQDMKEQDKLEEDFEIVGIIVDEIVPFSLEYYLGIEHEGDEDMGDDSDEDKDEEDEQDDKTNKKKKKEGDSRSKSKSKSKSKGKDAAKEKDAAKPDCKNQ